MKMIYNVSNLFVCLFVLCVLLLSSCSPNESGIVLSPTYIGELHKEYPSGWNTDKDSVLIEVFQLSDSEILITQGNINATDFDVTFKATLEGSTIYIPDQFDTIFHNGLTKVNHYRGKDVGIISGNAINYSIEYLNEGGEHFYEYNGTAQ